MPIYEYQCLECGTVFETIQKFSDAELTTCRCEREAPVKKLISAAAFHLKGSGWYVTDFRDKGKKNGKGSGDSSSEGGASSESDSGSKSETKSDGSSEAKSETKSETRSETKSEGKAGGKPEASGSKSAAD